VERVRARVVLLGVQSALALILLVGAGLFARSLARIEALPLGMDPGPVLVARLNTAGATYDDAALNEMLRALERNAAAAPEVEHAALTFTLPFGASASVSLALPERDSVPVTSEGGPYVNAVGADYFAALGTPIVAGRAFTADDGAGAARVVIVNETAARLWWPREEAVGKCVHLLDRTMPCATVVGVAANSRRQSLTEDETVQVFAPAAQSTVWAQPRLLLVRVRGGAPESTDGIQRVLQSAVPGLPFVNVSRLADRIASRARSWQLGAIMFGAFASLAIVLAAIGLYGVLAYDVSQRTREIGVRLALGSGALDVAAMVVRQGLVVASLGAAVGLVTAVVASPRVEQLLFQTSPLDPVVYLVALGVILFTAAVASWIPARRAGRVDPMVALRGE
jgi:predicted permease